jgi:hypothetical protein
MEKSNALLDQKQLDIVVSRIHREIDGIFERMGMCTYDDLKDNNVTFNKLGIFTEYHFEVLFDSIHERFKMIIHSSTLSTINTQTKLGEFKDIVVSVYLFVWFPVTYDYVFANRGVRA